MRSFATNMTKSAKLINPRRDETRWEEMRLDEISRDQGGIKWERLE